MNNILKQIEKLPKRVKKDEDVEKEIIVSLTIFKELIKNSEEYNYCYERISLICGIILNALRFQLNGMNMKALLEMRKLFDRKKFGDYLCVTELESEENKILYRGREGRHIEDAYEMLHIPFNRRKNVPTSRYGIYGYPCLYISTSVYGCWLEINKPQLEDFYVSRYELKKNLKVLDLANEEECKTKEEVERYLCTWPLICSSSIIVKESDRLFKSEYIIPQLLVQCIRSIQDNDIDKIHVDGIKYFSNKIQYNETLTHKPLYLNYIIMTDIADTIVLNEREYSSCIIDSFNLTIPVNAARLRNINLAGIESLRKKAYDLNIKIPSIKDDIGRSESLIEVAKNTYVEYNTSEFYYIEQCLCNIPAENIK